MMSHDMSHDLINLAGLSYRRHMSRVREKVAHMVKVVPSMAAVPIPPAALDEEAWQGFLHGNKVRRGKDTNEH